MNIRTERLLLRPAEESDWRDLQALWTDFSASPYAQYDRPHPTEEAEVKARAARWAAVQCAAHRFYMVCLDGRVIGYVACHERDEGVYECGYCFDAAFHGQGYAGEALRAIIGALREEGAKSLTAGTALDNAPSVRLLKAMGFELTGTERVSFYKDAGGNDIVFEGGVFERALNG